MVGTNELTTEEELRQVQVPIPCVFCHTYKTQIEFNLGNHLLERLLS
jgi:hypothetical protein